jgi:hypothetical protein
MRALAPILAAALAALACEATPLPGTQLGTFKVVATSKTNSCGLGAPNPWTFDVRLSRSSSALYWSWMDGRPILSGPLDGSSHAQLTDSQTGNVDPTDAGLGPCTLQRQDDLEVDLPEAGSGSFAGTLGYSFSAAAGADCSDQLSTSGGPFDALPCRVSYAMVGSPQ